MSGHSKWATTKHQKAVKDARRGKLFAKTIRLVEVAARDGGGNPESNPALADAISRARDISMPGDTIERAVKRGTGDLEGVKYESLVYEGYAPGGVAVIAEVLTDNRNRAAADVRRIFTKNGGTLGDPGSVAWMFTKKGMLLIPASSASEEDLMLQALEAGAEDLVRDGDYWSVACAPADLHAVRRALEEAGLRAEDSRIWMEPTANIALDTEASHKVIRLMDALDESDDVQEVYSNLDLSDELMAELNS